MKKLIKIIPYTLIMLISLLLFLCSTREKDNDIIYFNSFNNHNKVFSLPVPEHLYFAGEGVPMDMYYVREAFDRELTVNSYWHSSTVFMIKRAHRWFPVIEAILEKNGIPDDFKYLAVAESGLMNVVSPSGATGFWQILEGTGRELGMEINNNVDERYHVEKSTEAACKYLNKAFEKFGDWTLVAASYNAGMNQINDAIENQKVSNYYDLLLSEETARYVFRVLALKTILNNPARYGFYIRYKDLYQQVPFETEQVDYEIPDLAGYAQNHKINYRLLKEFNPWLRQKHLQNKSGKMYQIKIPDTKYLDYNKLIEQLENGHNIFNDTIKVENIL